MVLITVQHHTNTICPRQACARKSYVQILQQISINQMFDAVQNIILLYN